MRVELRLGRILAVPSENTHLQGPLIQVPVYGLLIWKVELVNGLMSDPHELLPKVLSVIKQGMKAGLHIGAQIYLSLYGEIVADFAVGESRPGVPMQPDTIMLWLSASKPITAVAVAQLWERGKLRLDEPVCHFVPEFGNHGKEEITVRHLLTHTGGFRTADKVPAELSWDEAIERICQSPSEWGWVPGEKAGYHISASWLMLGEIVRRLEGRPYYREVRGKIFEPIGMCDSWIGMPPEAYRHYGDRIGVMHNTEGGQAVPLPFWNSECGCALCRPGSNGRGPIRELGRFYEALLAGGWFAQPREAMTSRPLLLKPETIQACTTRQRAGLYDQTFQHVVDWGLGFIINSNRYGRETVPYGYGRHCSEETFGHSGCQSSAAFADPTYGLVAAWVFNGMPGERLHQQRAREVNTMIYEDLDLA